MLNCITPNVRTYALYNAMYSAMLVLFGAREAGCCEKYIYNICVHNYVLCTMNNIDRLHLTTHTYYALKQHIQIEQISHNK